MTHRETCLPGPDDDDVVVLGFVLHARLTLSATGVPAESVSKPPGSGRSLDLLLRSRSTVRQLCVGEPEIQRSRADLAASPWKTPKTAKPALSAGSDLTERRGRDLNPRRA